MSKPRPIEEGLAVVLRGGVVLSMVLVAAGLGLALYQGTQAGTGIELIRLGLLVLVATPVLRVIWATGVFALRRDVVWTCIGAAVLLVLAISFLLGAAGPA